MNIRLLDQAIEIPNPLPFCQWPPISTTSLQAQSPLLRLTPTTGDKSLVTILDGDRGSYGLLILSYGLLILMPSAASNITHEDMDQEIMVPEPPPFQRWGERSISVPDPPLVVPDTRSPMPMSTTEMDPLQDAVEPSTAEGRAEIGFSEAEWHARHVIITSMLGVEGLDSDSRLFTYIFDPACMNVLAARWWHNLGGTDSMKSRLDRGLANMLDLQQEELWQKYRLLSRLRVELLTNELRCLSELQHLAAYMGHGETDASVHEQINDVA
ncbi:hypothetical protein BU15DRAFT_68354 [Melanogaster broomeanus]|nr:hypothetical protein BU15DRAFT_68354 [Melanogaster broomeanus]